MSSTHVGVVSKAERSEATRRHLEALERDGPEVVLKGEANSSRRNTRALEQRKGVRSLEEILANSPTPEGGAPSHAGAQTKAPKILAPKRLCSVCGFKAPYSCSRCGARFCCRKCNATHQETRCLSAE